MVIEPTANTPKRILVLAELVDAYFMRETPDVLEIQWRKSRKRKWRHIVRPANKTSGGTTQCFGRYLDTCAVARISITAGTDWKDAKMVFLHEMAHAMTPGHSHDRVFWDKAFELYRWAKLPMLYCRKREMNYKKGALAAYRRNRKGVAA